MSAWTNGTYTKKGLALLAKLTQGNSLNITRAVTGTGYVTPSTMANQTTVTGIKQTLSFKAASYPETGVCKLPLFLTNKAITAGYRARQIGIYALDPDDGEILYFITQSEAGTGVPSEEEMPEYSATWTFYFRYGQADNVSVTVDPSHTITEDMLDEVRVIAETGVSAPNIGHALALKNTAELPFANLKVFGKTTQNGTPTPDNPVDLKSPSPSALYVFKRNLLPVSGEERTWNGITFTINYDGTVATTGTAADLAYINFQTDLPKGDYHVSGCPSGGNANTGYFVRVASSASGVDITEGDDTGNGLFLHLNERKTVIFRVAIRKGVTVDNLVFKPMICFEELKDGGFEACQYHFVPLDSETLRGIPVKSGGNYTDANGQQWICDEIDMARKVYIKRVGEDIFTEEDVLSSLTYTKRLRRETSSIDKSEALCNVTGKYSYNATLDETHFYVTGSNTWVFVPVDYDLTANPVKVQYALATPVETALSAETISAFWGALSRNPCTTITNDADANMEADCFLAQHEAGIRRLIEHILYEAQVRFNLTTG